MSTTKFTDATATVPGTLVQASWLNDVDSATYSILNSVAGTNTITATGPASLVTAYPRGIRFYFSPVASITGATTLNINGLGAKAITKFGSTPLVANDILNGQVAVIIYDGTEFQLLNPQATVSPNLIIPVSQGGTGATTVAAAQTALNVAAIGPTFSVNRPTTQAIPSGSITEVVFTTALFDTTSAVNLSTGRFTPNVAGYYHFDTTVGRLATGGVFQNEQVFLYKNGVVVYAPFQFFPTVGDAFNSIVGGGGGTIFLNGSTDYVSVFVYTQPTAGSVTVGGSATSTFFTGHFLHP